jgi:hypothetical protein
LAEYYHFHPSRRYHVADWQGELASFFQDKEQKKIETDQELHETCVKVVDFYRDVVVPAFEDVKSELEKYGRDIRISSGSDSASISVSHCGEVEFQYTLKVRVSPNGAIPYPETHFRNHSDGKSYKSQGCLRSGVQDYTVTTITKKEIILHLVADYMNHSRR